MAEHRATAEIASARPKSWAGIAIIVALWAAVAWLGWSLIRTIYD
jgi:hypothetical protein